MSSRGSRKIGEDRVVAIHHNGGLRKLCGCAKARWPQCRHAWHFNFAWKGKSYRFSLDRHLGHHVDSRTEAEKEADALRTAIRNGTFDTATRLPGGPPTHEPTDPRASAALAPENPSAQESPDPSRTTTLRKAGESWRKKRGYQLVASRDNAYRFKRFCEFTPPGTEPATKLGDKPVNEITADDIAAFRHERRSKGLSAVTTNHDLKLLRKMFAWFVREGFIAETPFRFRGEAVIKLDRETPRDRRFATSADEETVLGVAEALIHDVIVAMLDLCCRPGELRLLRWQNVDFLRREVAFRPQNAKIREGRRIPMTARLEAILKARRIGPDGEPLGPMEFVFGDEIGNPVKSYREQWNRARDRAGLGDLQLRDLRHEAGSSYEERGMPTTYVSKMLGHKSLATTTRYLNPTTERLHQFVEQIEEKRQKAAALAKSLQTEEKAEPDSGPPADGDPADKSLVS